MASRVLFDVIVMGEFTLLQDAMKDPGVERHLSVLFLMSGEPEDVKNEIGIFLYWIRIPEYI